PVDVEGRERAADKEGAPGGALAREALGKDGEDRGGRPRRGARRLGGVAVLRAEARDERALRMIARQDALGERRELVEHHEPPLPAEAVRARDLAAEACHRGTLLRGLGQEPRLG